jgi:hypothetical protein
LLYYWLGWGAYPASVTIILTGLLWLQHHLDRPLKWRWRPLVGAELTIFSLLGLTHTLAGRDDPWQLVGARWGGGLVGWAISVVLGTYLGWPAAVLILVALMALGLGLTFDVTWNDVKRLAGTIQRMVTGYAASGQPSDQVPGQVSPPPRVEPSLLVLSAAPNLSRRAPNRRLPPNPVQPRPRLCLPRRHLDLNRHQPEHHIR